LFETLARLTINVVPEKESIEEEENEMNQLSTERIQRIEELAVAGMSNRQIAKDVGTTKATVGIYVDAYYNRTGQERTRKKWERTNPREAKGQEETKETNGVSDGFGELPEDLPVYKKTEATESIDTLIVKLEEDLKALYLVRELLRKEAA
jgi:hypothetical protein